MTRVFGAASAAVVLASTLAHTQVNPFPAPKLVKTSKVRADGSLVPNSNSEKPSYPKLYDTPATAPSAQKVVAPNATPSNGKMIIQEMTCRFMIDGSGEVTHHLIRMDVNGDIFYRENINSALRPNTTAILWAERFSGPNIRLSMEQTSIQFDSTVPQSGDPQWRALLTIGDATDARVGGANHGKCDGKFKSALPPLSSTGFAIAEMACHFTEPKNGESIIHIIRQPSGEYREDWSSDGGVKKTYGDGLKWDAGLLSDDPKAAIRFTFGKLAIQFASSFVQPGIKKWAAILGEIAPLDATRVDSIKALFPKGTGDCEGTFAKL